MTSRAGAALVAVAAVVAAPAAARAATRVAVFSFEGYELPKSIEMAPYGLTAHLAHRLESAGMKVVEPALGLVDMLGAMSCVTLDEACAAKIAAHEKADVVVAGTLYGDSAARKAGKGGRDKGPLVWVRVQVFPGDGGAHRELDETVTGTVTAVTADFDRLSHLIVAMIDGGKPVVGPAAAPAALPAAAVAPARAGGGGRATTVLGIAALGAGALGAVVAVWMVVRWRGAKDAFASGVDPYRGADGVPEIPTAMPFDGERDLCSDGPGALTAAAAADLEGRGVFDACRRFRSSALVGGIAAAAAGLLAAAGVTLLVAGGGDGDADAGRESTPAAVRLVPDVGPGRAGLLLDVAF